MHKVAWFVRFRGDDRGESDRRWAQEHAPLCLALPGLVRCVQNRRVSIDGGEDSEGGAPVDGYVAMWWADRDAFVAALGSAQWQRMLEDAGERFDSSAPGSGMAEIEERVPRTGLGAKPDGLSTPPAGPLKSVGLLHYRADLDRDDVNAHWVKVHGPIALTVDEIGHYTQNHAIRPVGDGASLPLDGFSEAWFADAATFERAMASPGWAALGKDGPNMFDLDAISAMFVQERVLRG